MDKKTCWVFICILLLCTRVSAADDAVLLLHFDEGTGTIAHDASGHGNDGVIYGAQWADGVSGKALSYNGMTSYVGIPNLGNMTNAFTLAAWIKTLYSNPQIIMSGGEGDDQYRPLLGTSFGSSGNAAGSVNSDGDIITSVQDVDDGEWHQVVFSARSIGSRSTLMKMYIDGSLSEELIDPFPIQVRTGPGYIGKGASEHYFHGLIDEVSVYPRVLSPEEVRTLFTSKSAGRSMASPPVVSTAAAPSGTPVNEMRAPAADATTRAPGFGALSVVIILGMLVFLQTGGRGIDRKRR